MQGKLRWQHDGDTWVYTDEDLSAKNKKVTVKPEESLKVNKDKKFKEREE